MSRGKGTIDKVAIYELLKERDGLICGICGNSLEEEWGKYQLWLSTPRNKLIKRKNCELTIDHTFPKSLIRKRPDFKYEKGWWYSDLDNLKLSHWSCNNKKGNSL